MKMIRYELSRAFTTLGFKLSILIGAIIALSHFLLEGLPSALKLEEYVARNKGMIYPGWLYSQWMGGNSSSIQSFLYFLILPLLAALPYADSFYSDATGGYLGELCTRVHRVHYLIGKYIAVFLSGAIAAVFPLILNFLLSSFVYPAMKPEAALEISHLPAVSLSELYYSHPLVFWMIHIAMVFMISGLFAEDDTNTQSIRGVGKDLPAGQDLYQPAASERRQECLPSHTRRDLHQQGHSRDEKPYPQGT